MTMLKPGKKVYTESSRMECQVAQMLGGGGQGEVYKATIGNNLVALKWYFPHTALSQQRSALQTLIKKGPPNNKFLWPLDLTGAPEVPGFGYVMPLRDERFKGIVDLMKDRIKPSFRALATAGFELADSYLDLHTQGLCYHDISFGNVFFEPTVGSVLICDNDNVTVDGQKGMVLGTMSFMAPEIVCGEALPSRNTDLFSLAVLLFYMFMVHHPLEGKKEAAIMSMDPLARLKLYGKEATFIFDPDDHSNEPLPGYHDNALIYWAIYPQFLRDLFIQAFTRGIRDPKHGRVQEGQWRADMVRLRDAIFYCSSCKAENFYDVDALRISGGKPTTCWGCKQRLVLPFRIRLGKHIVMLNHDTRLYPHHIEPQKRYDFSKPVAEVSRHPTNPNLWGLKNLSSERWVAEKPDGTIQEVEVGRSLTLASGTKIHFGSSQGEIRYN